MILYKARHKSINKNGRNKNFKVLFAVVGIVVVFSVIFTSFVMSPSKVYAGGGAGSGGNGSGCSGNFWCTGWGWSWADYPIESGGPSDGFKSGAWSDAYNTCKQAGAKDIYVDVIENSVHSARGYNYLTSQENYYYHYSPGQLVDKSRVPAISTQTAKDAYDLVQSKGWTSGLTWGSDVAWVCANIDNPQPSNNQIQMHVFEVQPDGTFIGDAAGVTTDTCTGANPTTAGNGYAYFNVASGSGYCIRLTGGIPAGATGYWVRPWAEGYGNLCPTGYNGSNLQNHCPQQSYECQVAGQNAGVQPCGSPQQLDRTSDGGFDFVIIMPSPPPPPPPPSGCPAPWNNPNVTVSIPDTSPNDPAPSGGPVGGPPGSSVTRTQRVRQGRTKVTATDDISNPMGPSGPVGSPAFRLPLISESYQSATISYQPFIDQYPYDNNQANVTYDSYYDTHTWTGTDSWAWEYDHTECTGGYTDSTGFHCTSTADIWAWHYKGTSWTDNGISSANQTTSNTVNGPIMPPCFNRAYKNVNPTTDKPVFSPDNENPSTVTFGSHVNLDFYLSNRSGSPVALRKSQKVKLDINGDYYVKHPNGSITRPWPQGKVSGSISGTNLLIDSGSYSTSTVNYTQNYSDVFTATIPPLIVGDRACFTITPLQTSGQMDPDGNRINPPAPGGSVTTTENCSDPLVNEPYVKVFGNDVIAGGGFSGSPLATCTNASVIKGYYNGSMSGSSVQFAAQSIGPITGFLSSVLRSSSPVPPVGLSFGNTPSPGNLGGSHCIADYYSTLPAGAPNPGSSFDLNGMNGAYSAPSNVTITGNNIPAGKRIVVYVAGNVIINGDIKFQSPDTAWSSVDRIASLYIIAKGNIYIDPAVTNLDGVYVAQGSGATGDIYTCANGTTPVPVTSILNNCNAQLIIRGAFVADETHLLRGYSSMRYGNRLEYSLDPLNPPRNCGPSNKSVCGAEVFYFSPDMYLAEPVMEPINHANTGKYDNITSLPPIL